MVPPSPPPPAPPLPPNYTLPPAAAFEGCPPIDAYAASPAERESAFARLTATTWVELGLTLSLGRDGVLTRYKSGDDTISTTRASWNFVQDGADSGAIFTSDGSTIEFVFESDSLHTSLGLLKPGAVSTSVGRLAQLPRVDAPRPYRDLVGTCWRRANDFDKGRTFERLWFPSAYVSVVGLLDGTCEVSSSIRSVQDSAALDPSGNPCPMPVGSIGRPDVAGDLLVTDWGTFRPLSDPSDEEAFVFDSWRSAIGEPFQAEGAVYGGSVRVTGRYDGGWVQGASTTLSFELDNVAAVGARLHELTLVFQRYEALASGNGSTPVGDADYHELRSFGEDRLEPGGTRRFDVDVVPAIAGEEVWASLELDLQLFTGEPAHNLGAFSVPVAEGTPVAPTPIPTPSLPSATAPSYYSCGRLDTGIEQSQLAFSTDGKLLAVGAYDANAEVQIWDVGRRALDYRITGGAKSTSGTSVAFAGDSLLRVHTSALDQYALDDGRLLANLIGGGYDVSDWLGAPAVSPDGHFMLLPHLRALELWSTDGWKAIRSLQGSNYENPLWGVFSPSGIVAAVDGNYTVWLIDPQRGAVLRKLEDHTNTPVCAAFGEDGDLLVTGALDQTLVLWNTDDGSIRRRLDGGNFLRDCAVGPDGTLVALRDLDVTLFRTDVDSAPVILPGHDKTLIALSPDGARIAAGGFGFVEFFCREAE